jgi:UDP-2,4-diacetamido-2,4,6-trideoxy-beta-L-altropyranose hydrolase
LISNVIFRVDGSGRIGLGHLYRCLALAEILDREFEVSFVIREAPDSFIYDLQAREFSVTMITHESETLGAVNKGDILVLDGYDFAVPFFAKLRDAEVKLVYIDDLHDKFLPVDLVINHAPGVEPWHYAAITADNTVYALGLDYAILRKEFLTAARTLKTRESNSQVLICFGGADPYNHTERCLRNVMDTAVGKIDVVVGAAYAHESSLLKLSVADERITIYKGIDANEMVTRMLANSIAIVPSSGILFEALALEMSCLTFPYVDNQRLIFDGFKSMGVIFPVTELGKLVDQVSELLLTKGAKEVTKRVIDGLSGDRLLKKFKSLVS